MSNDTIELIRTTQIELAFPLDGVTWDEVGIKRGGRLHTIRYVSHRLLNAAIVGLMANDFLPEPNRALSYIQGEIDSIQEWAKSKEVVCKKCAKRKDKNGCEVCGGSGVTNQFAHLCDLNLPGIITDRMQRVAGQQVMTYRKNKSLTRIPSFGAGAPIMIRDGGWSLSMDEQNRYTFSVKLYGGRSPHTRFAVRPTKGWHYSLLKRIASDPTVKLGDCKIVWSDRRKKFFAKLAFTTNDPRPKNNVDPNIVMAINRGRHNFLYAAFTESNRSRILWPGEDILATKQKFAAIKNAHKRRMRVASKASRGHGKGRRYKGYSALGDAEARYVKTVCQQAAAHAVKAAKSARAGRVLLDNFGALPDEDLRYIPSWPYFQLKTAIKHAFEKEGVEVEEVESTYISSTCPRCGNVATGQHNKSTGVFHCGKCKFERDADLVATLNMLDAEVGIEKWQRGFEEERAAIKAMEEEIEKEASASAAKNTAKKPAKKTRKKKALAKQGARA